MRYKVGDRVWIIKDDDVILEVITATNFDYYHAYNGEVFLFGERGVIGYT